MNYMGIGKYIKAYIPHDLDDYEKCTGDNVWFIVPRSLDLDELKVGERFFGVLDNDIDYWEGLLAEESVVLEKTKKGYIVPFDWLKKNYVSC